ncbi:DUF6493 family protein [Caulobacter flavus]|nr:DUF6493 family protein [Caulobacter flavus]
MTPETLEDLVLAPGDAWPLQQACAGLDEKARAKLSSAAQKLHRQLETSKANKGASDRLKALLASRGKEGWRFYSSSQNNKAILALFALGPLSAVKKRDAHVWSGQDVAQRIISDRRPPWMDEWLVHDLEQAITWVELPMILAWVKEGVCRKPDVEGYSRMFAAYLMRPQERGGTAPAPPISRQLLDEPSLLEDVWRLFEVETIAFNTNGWLTSGASPDYETWPQALVKLSEQGVLDRARLLRAALDGLRLDIKENQLAGFHRFYALMAPTGPEILQHQPLYIDLLCHPVGHVVKFAIDMLAKVEKLGALQTDAVLREVQGVFASAGKGNAMAALKLIERLAARDEQARPQCLVAAVEALRHVNADVQAKALSFLQANADRLDETRRASIAELEDFVAASNKPGLLALAGQAAGEPAARAAPASASGVPLQPAVEAYVPIREDIAGQAILSEETVLAPIMSVDVLIDRVLHAVEVVDGPDEIELIIDAIGRLAGSPQSPGFERRVAPLAHRIKSRGGGSNGLGAVSVGVGPALVDLVLSWAEGRLYRTEHPHSQYYTQDDAFTPMIAHLRTVAGRAARRESRQLLSAPTHRGGWIDVGVWMDRLHALAHVPGLEQAMDFRLSLLRLAPDGRAQALERAAALPAALRRFVVFALGGEAPPAKEDRKDYAVLITAARCRAPLADWTEAFAPLGLDDEWPDSLSPARYDWRSEQKVVKHDAMQWKLPQFHVRVSRAVAPAPEAKGGLIGRLAQSIQGRIATQWSELPTAASARRIEAKHFAGDLNTIWVTQWLAHLWPQNPTGAQMKGVSKLSERIDENSSNWTPGFGFLDSLFQKNRPWGEIGHLLLCMGLIGKDADVKGLAVDALIEGIEGRVFDPAIFADVMARLGEGKWGKLNRLGEALLQVVPVSALHAQAVFEALNAWLPRLDLKERSAVHVLEVLRETQALTGRPLSVSALSALREMQGAGKAAKLAKDLCRPHVAA